MTSPAAYNLASLSLLAAAVFFALAAAVLGAASRQYRLSVHDETDLREQLADESPWMPEPVPTAQAGLQVVDGGVGASRRVHVSQSERRIRTVPRESQGENTREGSV